MMKELKHEGTTSCFETISERNIVNRIRGMSQRELQKCQNDRSDPAYFFAPNAFINVIDI